MIEMVECCLTPGNSSFLQHPGPQFSLSPANRSQLLIPGARPSQLNPSFPHPLPLASSSPCASNPTTRRRIPHLPAPLLPILCSTLTSSSHISLPTLRSNPPAPSAYLVPCATRADTPTRTSFCSPQPPPFFLPAPAGFPVQTRCRRRYNRQPIPATTRPAHNNRARSLTLTTCSGSGHLPMTISRPALGSFLSSSAIFTHPD